MSFKFLALATMLLATNAFAYSTLDCSSNKNITYSSHNKVGGARPFPGMITHVEEIQKDSEVIYRKVRREECSQDDFCNVQQPDMVDINVESLSFRFIENSKFILASEGSDMGPIKKETYAIKFLMNDEIWMVCDSFFALYP